MLSSKPKEHRVQVTLEHFMQLGSIREQSNACSSIVAEGKSKLTTGAGSFITT